MTKLISCEEAAEYTRYYAQELGTKPSPLCGCGSKCARVYTLSTGKFTTLCMHSNEIPRKCFAAINNRNVLKANVTRRSRRKTIRRKVVAKQ